MTGGDDIVVNSLWIGDELGPIELLTIKSFIGHGHRFKLWLYDKVKTPLPDGVEIDDAEDILPRTRIFAYKNKNEYGHGQGSVAGFSDIFRYKLLYEKGGWWVDMDVTCLKPLDFPEPYYFRKHHDLAVVGNVIKCPASSELMRRCYEEAVQSVDADNTDWHKPIAILNANIAELNLLRYIRDGQSNIDRWEKTNRFILTDARPMADWYYIHWQNEEWKYRGVSRERFYYRSYVAELLSGYGLCEIPYSFAGKLFNSLQNLYDYAKNASTYF